MRQRILRLLITHSSFTKFIFLIYYSHITKITIAAITLRNGQKNTINGVEGRDASTDKGSGHLLNGDTEVKVVSYVQSDRSIIANLEKNLTFIPEYNLPLKIMPLGDSITYGIIGTNARNSGGYRTELWNKFVADGLNVEFVGSLSSGPDSFSSKKHEGHPGWTIRQIADSVNERLDTFRPDIVLLMIGTNDTRKSSLRTMLKDFSALIDQITAHSPNARLLVASIPPIHPSAKPAIRGLRAIYFNTAIPAIVNSKVAQGKKVNFVDMRSLTVNDLTSSLSLNLDNGLHLNAQGYRKIAIFWHNAVSKVISNRQMSTSVLATEYL